MCGTKYEHKIPWTLESAKNDKWNIRYHFNDLYKKYKLNQNSSVKTKLLTEMTNRFASTYNLMSPKQKMRNKSTFGSVCFPLLNEYKCYFCGHYYVD